MVLSAGLMCEAGDAETAEAAPNVPAETAGESPVSDAAAKTITVQAQAVRKVSRHPVLLYLKTRSELIAIMKGPKGRLYTIKDEKGAVILRDATVKKFQAELPGLYKRLAPAIGGVFWAGM